MKLVKVLKLLICFVLIVPLFAANASANANYDHDALMQYEGYGKAMYDSIVEQTTFVTGEYTNNKDYVRGSMNQIKDYADFWYNEYNDFTSSCYQSSAMNCLGEMTERGGAYVLTLGDWIKKIFGDYDELENSNNDGNSSMDGYIPYFEYLSQYHVRLSAGYKYGWGFDNVKRDTLQVLYYGPDEVQVEGKRMFAIIPRFNSTSHAGTPKLYVTNAEANAEKSRLNAELTSVSAILNAVSESGVSIVIFKDDTQLDIPNLNPNLPAKNVPLETINNYIQQSTPEVVVPEIKPSLVCPDGTKIQMSISGSTFLAVDGSVMLVNKDGTAEVNGSICNLNWQKPNVDYVDGKASILDSDGNWLEIGTGGFSACLDPNGCKPTELDNSLIEYVKNAYQYATGFLKTGTDGLKSLANGAKDLTSLFGTFFSWLPSEMVVLMASGLGITVGLRLFRK